MTDYAEEEKKRVACIRAFLQKTGAKGVVFGNSGGKDCALVGILCKKACENVIGVIMPCESKINYGSDKSDAERLAEQFGIASEIIDLTEAKQSIVAQLGDDITSQSLNNIAPRLRMTALYAVAAKYGYLVAGTGNKNERFMGYFTKWGDGAFDFDPIADLSVEDVYGFLRYFNAPSTIINKAPSAGLFEGQTDEKEMGVTYKEIEDYMEGKPVSEESKKIIERFHRISEHKRSLPPCYPDL